MKQIKSLALAAFLFCALGTGVRAGDIGTPGKTATTGETSAPEVVTTDTTDEIMLQLLLAVISLT
ncbi:MAG TPA: hypothetical protein VJ124_26600 [Pyrinomonadaceae bacterium]|nr:hypothetical protein [Pyrinomonadaceae bacterium]